MVFVVYTLYSWAYLISFSFHHIPTLNEFLMFYNSNTFFNHNPLCILGVSLCIQSLLTNPNFNQKTAPEDVRQLESFVAGKTRINVRLSKDTVFLGFVCFSVDSQREPNPLAECTEDIVYG